MNKIFGMVHNGASCDYHRVELPLKFIPDVLKTNKLEDAGIILFNRTPTITLKELIKYKDQKLIIMDLDDYWELPDWHPMHRQFATTNGPAIIEGLKIADIVTTTTDRLATHISKYNKNVYVIPNALPFGLDQFTVSTNQHKSEVIYTGESSHIVDISLIKGLRGVATMNIPGFDLGGRKIARRPVQSYMQVYDSANIALAPIKDGDCEYNRCKSNLKLLEAASKHIPIIASNVPTFNNCGAPILYENWETSIKILGYPDLNKELGSKLYDWANTNYNLLFWNNKRLDLYYKQ